LVRETGLGEWRLGMSWSRRDVVTLGLDGDSTCTSILVEFKYFSELFDVELCMAKSNR
jgi:hypothetical protein